MDRWVVLLLLAGRVMGSVAVQPWPEESGAPG